MKKNVLLIVLWCCANILYAQSPGDTLSSGSLLHEVVIQAVKKVEDYRLERPASDLRWMTSDLGTWLEKSGMAIVTANGAAGAASSVRFRGLASDHSLFSWNDIPVNSVTLGTCDMSMLPVFFFDEIRLYSGADNTSVPAAGPGMTMALCNNPDVEHGQVSVLYSMNSLYNSGLAARVQTSDRLKSPGNWTLRTSSKVFFQDIRNRFYYADRYLADAPVREQEHNDGRNRGWMQDIYIGNGRHLFSAHAWIQERSMHLPALMGKMTAGTAEQDDSFARFLLAHSYAGKGLSVKTSLARLEDKMHYTDSGLSFGAIDSRIRTQVWYANTRIVYRMNEHLELLSNNLISAQEAFSDAFAGGSENLLGASLSGGLHAHLGPLHLAGDYRHEWRNHTDGSSWTGRVYYVFSHKQSSFEPEFRIARRYRLPDMNELFWQPGGNRDLLPEQGLITSLRLPFLLKMTRWEINTQTEVSWNRVKDWIQWVPGASGIWSPLNYRDVGSMALECPIEVIWHGPELQVNGGMRYHFTDARTIEGGEWNHPESRTMIYTPRHMLTSHAGCVFGNFGLDIQNRFIDKRYTDEDNNELRALPAYDLWSVSASYAAQLAAMELKCNLTVDNLGNVSYESVRSYAMPGRVISIGISLTYILNEKQKQDE